MEKTVGILGGGQLGRMLAEAANRLNVKVVTLDKKGCPASQVTLSENLIEGSFKDPQAIKELASRVDIITTEIEHVNADALQALIDGDATVAGRRALVQPHPSTMKTILDKFDQKEYLLNRNFPVARSVAVKEGGDVEDVRKAVKSVGGCPVSVFPCRTAKPLREVWHRLLRQLSVTY